MDFKAAMKECRKVGTAHAQGDALKAMYADLIAAMQGGKAEKYYQYLQAKTDSTESGIRDAAVPLLRDRATAWDVLMEVVR